MHGTGSSGTNVLCTIVGSLLSWASIAPDINKIATEVRIALMLLLLQPYYGLAALVRHLFKQSHKRPCIARAGSRKQDVNTNPDAQSRVDVYPTRSGKGGLSMGLRAYDHGTFPSPNTPSPRFKRFKESSVYPLFFHILAHSFAHFCTHAKLNPFVFKQFLTLCAIREGGVVVTSTPYSPDRLELSTASDVAVLGDQRQALGQGGRANEAVAGITGIIRGQLVGQDGNFHGDGPDGRPGRDLLDEVLHGSPKAKAAVSRQPRQLPQSDRRDGNPALFDGRTDSVGGLFREFRGIAGEPNQDVGIQEDHFFMTFHCFSGSTWSISPVILNSPAMKPKRLFCGARRERPLRPA